MFRSIVICPDRELGQKLEVAVTATGHVEICRKLQEYPAPVDLIRSLRAHAPDLIFLSFESPDKARDLIKFLEAEAENVQIIGVLKEYDPALLLETMRSGVREVLADPFEQREVMESLSSVKALLDKKPVSHESSNQIFTFLPSKAGVGTSTIALNVSSAMARRPDTNVILSDFDLNSGMLRFMLKLQNEYSVIDAVEHAAHFDEHLWPQLVTSIGRMDVLHAGRINPNLRLDSAYVRNLVGFMRRNYAALCFDLSGNLERYSIELMMESKRVLLVCTPEVPSLHLAREKLHFLRTFELQSRVSVVLNRCHKKPMFTKEQVEELLGVPVVKMFANDYIGVNRAMTAGSCIAPDSEMGKAFTAFAEDLLEKRVTKQVEKKKFLEYFNVAPRALVQD